MDHLCIQNILTTWIWLKWLSVVCCQLDDDDDKLRQSNLYLAKDAWENLVAIEIDQLLKLFKAKIDVKRMQKLPLSIYKINTKLMIVE